MPEIILTAKDLRAGYTTYTITGGESYKEVLHGVSFDIEAGEILGLVGESGSGKSTLARAVLGLLKPASGSISGHVGRPQVVFQDPFSALNPAFTIRRFLEEPLRAAGVRDRAERHRRIEEIGALVGFTDTELNSKPSELSGGQRQRASIAAAILAGPRLLVADEPVSALDVTIVAQILALLKDVRERTGVAILFISHDLNVIYQICDRVMVMRDGEILEIKSTRELFHNPQHPYTKELLEASV